MDPITIGTAVGTSLLTQFVAKGDSAPIKTLDNLWYLAFGNFNSYIDKMRAKHHHNLEKYKKDLVKEVQEIPDDNLIEPALNIVGPALEASKYYIDEEELRLLFAKLVSSSMDNRKCKYTHPAFVEIIKQLSVLDASNLSLFKDQNHLPLLNMIAKKESGGEIPIFKEGILHNPKYPNIMDMQSSISNLVRLRLVVIHFDLTLKDESVYQTLENSEYLQNHLKTFDSITNFNNSFKRGLIELSPLGENFKKVCL